MGLLRWGLVTAALIALIIGAILYLGSGIEETSLERFTITGLEDVTTNSFTINGDFYFNNPSSLDVPVRTITYEVILEENEEVIGEGMMAPFTLEAGESTTEFSQEIRWQPSAQLLTTLLAREEAIIRVEGTIKLGIPILQSYEIPFSQEQDIKNYLQEQNPVGDGSDDDSLVPEII